MNSESIAGLLRWYRLNRADLPWRRDPSPYHVWLAEVMLQQTQVESVIPYYRRFLAAFPTIADLAEAPLDAVLKCWEGLGYYSRARNLHRAARLLIAEYDGALPSRVDELLANCPASVHTRPAPSPASPLISARPFSMAT